VTNNECATLVLIDKWGTGCTSYTVTWDGNEITNSKQSDALDKIIMGDCSITSCPQYHTLLSCILTDYYPEDFSWELVDTNNNVLTYRSNYEDANRYYYYGLCAPDNECATLRLFDSYGNGGTYYIVSWDGNVIRVDKQRNTINPEIVMGNYNY